MAARAAEGASKAPTAVLRAISNDVPRTVVLFPGQRRWRRTTKSRGSPLQSSSSCCCWFSICPTAAF